MKEFDKKREIKNFIEEYIKYLQEKYIRKFSGFPKVSIFLIPKSVYLFKTNYDLEKLFNKDIKLLPLSPDYSITPKDEDYYYSYTEDESRELISYLILDKTGSLIVKDTIFIKDFDRKILLNKVESLFGKINEYCQKLAIIGIQKPIYLKLMIENIENSSLLFADNNLLKEKRIRNGISKYETSIILLNEDSLKKRIYQKLIEDFIKLFKNEKTINNFINDE